MLPSQRRLILAILAILAAALAVAAIVVCLLRRKKEPGAASAVAEITAQLVEKEGEGSRSTTSPPAGLLLAETVVRKPAAWFAWVEKPRAATRAPRLAIERFEVVGRPALPFTLWALRNEDQAEGRDEAEGAVLVNLTPQTGTAQAGPVPAPPSATRPSHLLAADRWLFVWHGEAEGMAAEAPRVSVWFADAGAAGEAGAPHRAEEAGV
jgi:hypothetical protein